MTLNLLSCDGHVTIDHHFLHEEEASALFGFLLQQINWQTETINMYGRDVRCPRLVSWFGDLNLNYTYSGRPHATTGWIEPLHSLKEKLEETLVTEFNFVLCNLYQNGLEYMGWHDDGEKALGPTPTIASISLGATRPFDMRHKTKKIKQSFVLNSGSLLVMSQETQQYWQHRLPKYRQCHKPRINLTFRNILT